MTIEKLLQDYFDMTSEIEAHEHMQSELRKRIEEVIAESGAVKIRGLGSASITPASVSHSYDSKAIDKIISDCLLDGDVHTARKLSEARKESARKASLRIIKDK